MFKWCNDSLIYKSQSLGIWRFYAFTEISFSVFMNFVAQDCAPYNVNEIHSEDSKA